MRSCTSPGSVRYTHSTGGCGGELQPRAWTDPGSPAPNTASTAGCTAIVAASSALPCRHALMNADAASSGDAAGLSGTVAGGAVVVVVLALAVVLVVDAAADDCD